MRNQWGKLKKSGKVLLVFFALMIAFTIISRITYNFIVPEVVVGSPIQNTIEHSISTQGTVYSQDTIPVYTVEGLIVSGIQVYEGQIVSEDDMLYTVEKSSLDERILRCQHEADVMGRQLREMKKADGKKISTGTLSMEYEYDEKTCELEKLRDLQQSGYGFRAPCSGTVMQINRHVGDKTTGEADMILAGQKGNLVKVVIPVDEESASIKQGTHVDVTLPGGEGTEDCKVASVSVDGLSGELTIIIDLGKEKAEVGQTVSLILGKKSSQYNCCVPRSALHMDGNSYFVYTMRQEDNILGEETVSVKTPVRLLDSNIEYAAIEGVSEGQKIIIHSNRTIDEGTKVKVME